uniref:Uncharacterized protein n=1 Tax=Periophthalmus magnuspinnatus TaxID=409849 RepID=A0A3B3ZWV6_9GOBI
MDVLQRRVAQEDTVQYKLFLVQFADINQIEKRLTNLMEEIWGKFATLLAQYIWHHQPFNLKLYHEKDIPAHLGGSTQFTDNVEDEWFIVYLLQQITEAFPELAARYYVQVFIYRGDMHIIPCPTHSNTVGIPKDEVPSLAKALSLLSSNSDACHPSSKISSAVKMRLKYPEKIQTELHHAHCFIPASIALVLAKRPDLVAPAVSAFYLRDPVDLQACRNFKMFPPDVTFTRCLFAQLQQQQFTPDRRSGFALPPRSDPKYKAHDLGMKLAHGFEILCSKTRMPSSEPNVPVSCNPQWKGFIECLKRNGYFKGEIEGSMLYKELIYTAENFFKGDEVLQLLQSLPTFSLEELKEKESQLPPEDDSWLDITEQDLEQMLQERARNCDGVEFQKSSVSHSKDEPVGIQVEKDAGYSLVAVSQGVKNFLNAMSSHEGAELPFSQPFSFDPNSMVNALDNLLMNEAETLNSLKKYMDQMDEELMGTDIGKSFNQAGETEEDIQPLDIDLNLITNLLESLSSQAGLAGPASNLIQSLGIHLPPNSDPS